MSIPRMDTGARLAVVLLAAISAGFALETPAPALAPEVVALANAHAKHLTMAGTFRWLTGSTDGTAPIRERVGEFAVARATAELGTRYHVRTSAPDQSEIIRWWSDGRGRWVAEQAVADDTQTVRRYQPGDHDLDVDQVIACVLLDVANLAEDFSLAIVERAGARRLEMTPTAANLREHLASCAVVLDGERPREVIIDDTRGVRIRVEFTTLAFDRAPDPRVFQAPADQ